MDSREGTAPALNEYKVAFFRRRFLQTILGGVDLLAKGSLPLSVRLFQLCLLIYPVILAVPFTLLIELHLLRNWISELICAGLSSLFKLNSLGCFVICNILLQWISFRVRRKVSMAVLPLEPTLADDDEYYFEGFFSPEAFHFLLPPKDRLGHLVSHVALSGLIMGLSVGYLLPSRR